MNQVKYIKGLDALRFFAFLLVYLSHIQYSFPVFTNGFLAWFKEVSKVGYLGVDLFFVLSAFLLTSKALSEIEKTGTISLKEYFKRRSLRILPLYVFILILTFSIPLLQTYFGVEKSELPSIFYYITFTLNFKATQGDQFLMIILWTLSLEAQFYIFNALALKFFKKIFFFINILLILISLLFRYFNLEDHLILHYHTLSLASCFAIGNLLAIYLSKKKRHKTMGALKPFIGIIPVLLIMVYPYIIDKTPVFLWLEKVVFPLGFSALIFAQTEPGIFNFSRNKRINYLGKISYGLYCYHGLTIAITINILDLLFKTKTDQNWILTLMLSLSLTIIFAHLSFQYFEKYFLNKKTN